MKTINIDAINSVLKDHSPSEIITWALEVAERPVITTNFRPYESAILFAVSRLAPNIKVKWCDTGSNTPNTYNHDNERNERLRLTVQFYDPKQAVAFRDTVMGIPDVNDPMHSLFTEQVKLEPFRRAMNEHKPDVWFTNLRQGQTEFRNSIDVVSESKSGILKVSPFYSYADARLDSYLERHKLPNEFNYFDPTKVLENRECGLHS